MKLYSPDTIEEAMERITELKTMPLRDLCAEAEIRYSIKWETFRQTIICDIIIIEFGHDMLLHWLVQEEKEAMPELINYVKLEV